jgi:hypothetical protein
MQYIPLARCTECQQSGRCVAFNGATLCSRCLSLAVAKLVNERTYRHKRRAVEGNEGRSKV